MTNKYNSMYFKLGFDHKLTYVAIVTRKLMDEFGLTKWDFKYNRGKLTLGLCFYPIKGYRGRIELSKHLVKLNDIEQIHDIVLHEIAHALVGPNQGHNNIWKTKAKAIGAVPSRVCCKANCVPYNYSATCPSCGSVYFRYRRAKKSFLYCKLCGPKLGLLRFKKHDQRTTIYG